MLPYIKSVRGSVRFNHTRAPQPFPFLPFLGTPVLPFHPKYFKAERPAPIVSFLNNFIFAHSTPYEFAQKCLL
jgi:hypothetical protein